MNLVTPSNSQEDVPSPMTPRHPMLLKIQSGVQLTAEEWNGMSETKVSLLRNYVIVVEMTRNLHTEALPTVV